MINFGDCLVRSEGAIALAAVLREGLPVLKVSSLSELSLFCLSCQQAAYSALLCSFSPGAQSVIWRDHRGSSFRGGSGCHGQTLYGESGSERYEH